MSKKKLLIVAVLVALVVMATMAAMAWRGALETWAATLSALRSAKPQPERPSAAAPTSRPSTAAPSPAGRARPWSS